jgi:hypothetical protein
VHILDAPKDMEGGASADYATKAEAGTAEYLIELEKRRSIKVYIIQVIISYNHHCNTIQIGVDLCCEACAQREGIIVDATPLN